MASGLCAQLGVGVESTVGTAVTVNKFLEVNNIKPKHNKITKVSEGLRACGRVRRERDRVVTGRAVEVETEATVMSKGFGVPLSHMLGSTPTPTQIGVTPLYRQIHTVADLTGKGLTVQGGFPESYSTTVRPFTYNGCKVSEWELSCEMDDFLKLALKLDGWNWTGATALAVAAFLTDMEAFHWAQLQILIGGTPTTATGRTTVAGGVALKGVRKMSLKGENALANERRLAGGAGIKSEQIENGFRVFKGELDAEFADRAQISDQFDSDGSTALQFIWTGLVDVGSGSFPKLAVTLPKIKFDTGFPEVGGPDVVEGKAEFSVYEDNAAAHPPIQIEYESTDTAL